MKLRTKVIVVGALGAVGVMAGAVVAIRAIRRATKRVINHKLRSFLSEAIQMKAEDYIPGGKLGKSLFRRRLETLSDKQLAALCALVQVGYFVKVSGIDPLHPTKEQIERAVNKYFIEERLAPQSRPGMLTALDTTDAREALIAAFGVLADA